MKKFALIMFVLFAVLAGTVAHAKNTYRPKAPHTYITGPKGGCYYINRNGRKTYVDRALCQTPKQQKT